MKILAFDIGGANTKKLVMDSEKISSAIFYFPVWKKKDELRKFLKGLKEEADAVGITMTAELSDVFSCKKEGVEFVLSTCEDTFAAPLYLSTEGKLLKSKEVTNPLSLAAANFVASLYFLENKFGEGILVDVGTTTTDIVPFRKGKKLYKKTDLQRLQAGQLIYTGILRTPVSAILSSVPFRGRLTRIASEYFAITGDVYNVLNRLENYSCDTPDGKGKSKKDSMRRIARLLCADLEEVSNNEITKICKYVHEKQVQLISHCISEIAVAHDLDKVYICGTGKALAKEACSIAGIKSFNMSKFTKAKDNLPCLGLAHMVRDYF